jgi:hypothetical protein
MFPTDHELLQASRTPQNSFERELEAMRHDPVMVYTEESLFDRMAGVIWKVLLAATKPQRGVTGPTPERLAELTTIEQAAVKLSTREMRAFLN